MVDEATVTADLRISKDLLQYAGLPQSFNADVSVGRGPTPGVLTVPTTGIDVDLSVLTQPGLCRMMNLDETNYVEWGIEDPETGKFYPLGEMLPGEIVPFRFSRNLGEEQGTGSSSSTTGPTTNTFHLRANAASCDVIVEAFDT